MCTSVSTIIRRWSRGFAFAWIHVVAANSWALDVKAVDDYVSGKLASDNYPSITIGVVRDQELILAKSYGVADRETGREARPESLYYIGSVTKVFTTTLMCVLRDQGRLRLDDPVSQYLPNTVKLPTDARGDTAITLRHLATHSSGLPSFPPNLTIKEDDPFGAYTLEQLYAGLPQVMLQAPIGAKFMYSNLGVGLLGQVLERAAREPYEQALKKYLLDPLGMKDTAITLSSEQHKRLTTGYRGNGFRAQAAEWQFGCLVAAGGMASTVLDLARFLSLQFRAGQANVWPVSGSTLSELHRPQRLADESGDWSEAVGLGWQVWMRPEIGEVVWHNGGVAGHSAFIGFSPKHKIGVIVLTNASWIPDEIGCALLDMAVERQHTPTTKPTSLPSAEKILDCCVEATGGKAARQAIKNQVICGQAELAGLLLDYEAYSAVPNSFRLRVHKGAVTFIESGVKGDIAWERAPFSKPEFISGQQRDQVVRAAYLLRDVSWRDFYQSAICVGVTIFSGAECYKVILTPISGSPCETGYYDTKTCLLRGTDIELDMGLLGKQPVREINEDYRRFGAILQPTKLTQEVLGQSMVFTVESVKYNVTIPPDMFELPVDINKKPPDSQAASSPADSVRPCVN